MRGSPNSCETSVKDSAGGRKSLARRVDRLLSEMTAVVAFDTRRWRESLRVLLTHPRPPSGLVDFHKSMRAATLRARYDDSFVDLLIAALAASDRSLKFGELVAPIQIALLSFIGGLSRRPSVLMSTVSQLIGGTDIEPPLYIAFSTMDRKCRPLELPKHQAMANIRIAVMRAVKVLLDERATGAVAFAGWVEDECLAGLEALWLAYTYCEQGTGGIVKLQRPHLQQDLTRFGAPLWRQLDTAYTVACARARTPQRLDTTLVFGRLLLSVQSADCDMIRGDTTPRRVWSGLTHVVCRSAIPDSSEKYDAQEIARHRVLEQPLPVTAMPTRSSLENSLGLLLGEFPWAAAAIRTLFDDLLGRANLGVRELTLPATLLIGQPGAGKSRLARRIAEELDLPRLDVSLSGSSDTKILGGTSRGWASGRPNDLASLMARRETASVMVMLDEIDKAHDGHREGGGIAAYLLPLLEPETASRQYDSFLKTECDFSRVSWLCTANTLSGISNPLRSRLRILFVPQPRREHLPNVCTSVIAELEERWHIPAGTIPSAAELKLDLDGIASARQARAATESAVVRWARSVVKH